MPLCPRRDGTLSECLSPRVTSGERPLAYAKDAGLSGSQRPVWLLFVLTMGALAGVVDLVREPSMANGLWAVGFGAGAIAVEAWLVRWYRLQRATK